MAGSLFQDWDCIERSFRRAENVALFSDFDGTLAAIRRRPADVCMSPRFRTLLAALRDSGVVVGIISGRCLDDLQAVVRVPNIWYAGEHGLFIGHPSGATTRLATRQDVERIARLRAVLAGHLAALPGIRLEPKKAAVAVHYRGAPAASVQAAGQVLREAVERIPNLRVIEGKKVWDILPGVEVDKWTALRFILRQETRERSGSWLPFFLGDDTTDEIVFRHLEEGITVSVGKRRDTSARYCLRSPAEVAVFLGCLRELLVIGPVGVQTSRLNGKSGTPGDEPP